MAEQSKKERGPLVSNRQARHEYHVDETFEAGLSLVGTEVKSLRSGHGSLQDAWVDLRDDGAWLIDSHVSEYTHSSTVFNHKPRRERRLLLHARELARLAARVQQKGYTLIPLAIFPKGRWLKVEVGLCRGKKQYDKREDIKERDTRRELERDVRGRAG